ncbi:hypothetical protein OCU04_007196 [Sclerotinia nivalis]|uniref:Uncharacterized protein n=1 Tax=Sclerotinia nivalis TaxID=352851 RepID=A0A9X0DIL4_9HELO|nr:hypothetical protein OCU04_007196 [Sclerotinia nivalis]
MATKLTNEIRSASESLDSPTYAIPLHEKQDLLSAAKELVEKLEGPEIGVWRVVFGVSRSLSLILHGMRLK